MPLQYIFFKKRKLCPFCKPYQHSSVGIEEELCTKIVLLCLSLELLLRRNHRKALLEGWHWMLLYLLLSHASLNCPVFSIPLQMSGSHFSGLLSELGGWSSLYWNQLDCMSPLQHALGSNLAWKRAVLNLSQKKKKKKTNRQRNSFFLSKL